MFDVGFSELIMVGLVALLVIGPEKLPKAARIAGFWLGKARSTIAHVKIELKQELHAEEMRQLLQQHSLVEELQQAKAESEAALHDINSAFTAIAETKPIQHDDPTT
jgi:sec-independent protein translocase protein TatB